jgi:hypothetical protein
MTHIFSGGPVRMFRLTNEPGGSGLSSTPDGVSLAGVPLVRKTPAGFVPRPTTEIASLLKAAYGERPMPLQSRLGAIAQALNSGDFATAMIAAVHTQTPELSPEAALWLANAEQQLTKHNCDPNEPRDWHGRWTGDGSAGPASIITPAAETGEQTVGADNRPRRVAENTLPPGGSVSPNAPVSSDANISAAPDAGEPSRKPTTRQEAFEQKYDELGPEDFSKKIIEFGYWLETQGRDLSPAGKEQALAEYAFLQSRLSSRLSYEYSSIWDPGYLRSAGQRLFQGASNSDLVPVSPLPPSMLDVAGAIALLEAPSRGRPQPTRMPFAEDGGGSEFLRPSGNVGRGDVVDSTGAAAVATTNKTTAAGRAAQLAEFGLNQIQRERFVTLAVTETKEGVRVVSSNTGEVQRSVRQLLQEGEIYVDGVGHAEVPGSRLPKLSVSPRLESPQVALSVPLARSIFVVKESRR